MQNSQENTGNKQASNNNKDFSIRFYDFCFKMSNQHLYMKQLYNFIAILSICLTTVIYIALPQMNIIPIQYIILDAISGLCLMLVILFILIELLIGILKGFGGYLRLQTYIYLNTLFIIGFLSIIHQVTLNTFLPTPVALVVIIICTTLAYLIGRLFGSQSYYSILINTSQMPLILRLIPFQLILCLYTLQNPTINNLLLLIMIIISVITRLSTFEGGQTRKVKGLQYFLLQLSSSLNLFYTVNLVFLVVFDVKPQQIGSTYFFCFMFLIIVYEMLSCYVDHMKPFPNNFFDLQCNLQHQQFISYCQYVATDISKIMNSLGQKIQLSDTCIPAIYYEHLKCCNNLQCELPHQFSLVAFSNTSKQKYTPYKGLCSKINWIMEYKFKGFIQRDPQNIDLKLGIMHFYVITGFNKLKVLQLITEVQVLGPSLLQKIQLYRIKKLVIDVEASESFENMKVDNSVFKFIRTIHSTLGVMIDFWGIIMQERVDFNKVIKSSEKLFPLLQSLEQQFNDTILLETYSTIKIMKVYSEFIKWVFKDEEKTIMISDYIQLLGKKLLEMNEISYISAESEKALIAISLNEKNLGQIKMVNNQACNIFYYPKDEMEKMNIRDFMPKTFSIHHNSFLQAFLKNSKKKLNTDSRLVLGKNKQGHLFQIYLQLRRSVITISQDLMFFAGIEIAKTKKASMLTICNQQGELMEYNSGFYYFFLRTIDKKGEVTVPIKNIQQIVPNFYSNIFDWDGKVVSFTEIYDNKMQGVTEIKFEVTKLSFPKQRDAGYLIKGEIIKEVQNIFFPHLNLTKSLLKINYQKKELKGNIMAYNSKKHEYLLESNLRKFYNNQILSIFTIPFIKLEAITGAIMGKDRSKQIVPQQFDQNIKTIRLCRDHYERVEEPESFDTESDIDDYHKENNMKLLKLRTQFSNNSLQANIGKYFIINYIMSIVILITVFVTFYYAYQNNQVSVKNLARVNSSSNFRTLLSQYVVYLEIEQTQPTEYTILQKQNIMHELIKRTMQSDLPEQQKQNALRIIDLQQNQKVKELMKDQTFKLPEDIMLKPSDNFKILKIVFCCFLIIKIVNNILLVKGYRGRLLQIFNFFLGLPEFEIRKATNNCVFVSNNISNQNSLKKVDEIDEQANDSDESDQHVKIRKFRNISLENQNQYYSKVILTSALIIILMIIGYVFYVKRKQHFGSEELAFNFMNTVVPESSVYLMKVYLNQNQDSMFGITESFNEKIQTMDYNMARLSSAPGSHLQNFFTWFFESPCEVMLQGKSPNCETVASGVLKDGVSKALNYMLTRLPLLIQSQNSQEEMLQYTKLLYQNIYPIFQKLNKQLLVELERQYWQVQLEFQIELVFLCFLILLDFLYLYYGPYRNFKKRLESAELLLKIIPQEQKKKKNHSGYEKVPN